MKIDSDKLIVSPSTTLHIHIPSMGTISAIEHVDCKTTSDLAKVILDEIDRVGYAILIDKSKSTICLYKGVSFVIVTADTFREWRMQGQGGIVRG